MARNVAQDAHSLMTPRLARQQVSRQELVNLMVVQFQDEQNQEIKRLEEATSALSATMSTTLLSLYTRFREVMWTRTSTIATPWVNCVAAIAALTPETHEITLASSLPDSDKVATEGHYLHETSDHHRHDRNRALMSLIDVVHTLVGHPAGYQHNEAAVRATLASGYLEVEVSLTFQRVYAQVWHSLSFPVSLEPPADPWTADVEEYKKLRAEHNALRDKTNGLRGQISDIPGLERRALARLTMAALTDATDDAPIELPRLL
jgi:hypothetical protein